MTMSGPYLWQPPAELPQPPADFGPGYRTPTEQGADACCWTAEGTSFPADWQRYRPVPHGRTEPAWMQRITGALTLAAVVALAATVAVQSVRLLPASLVTALAAWGVFSALLLGALACAGAEGRRAARGRCRYPGEGD